MGSTPLPARGWRGTSIVCLTMLLHCLWCGMVDGFSPCASPATLRARSWWLAGHLHFQQRRAHRRAQCMVAGVSMEEKEIASVGQGRANSLYPQIPFDFETQAMPQHQPEDEGFNMRTLFEAMTEEAHKFEGSPLLVHQMQKHVIQRSSLYEAMASVLAAKLCSEDHPQDLLYEKLFQVLQTTPKLMSDMCQDLKWIQEVDPATHGLLQPFLYFKGFHAVQIQRIGHSLWQKSNPTDKMLALSLQSRSAEVFGVDAHPGAELSHAICLDHATGVVIGETAKIGHNCYILHGVTLGATGKAGTFDRHPKVGNHVKIGAGAMILGNIPIENDVVVGAAAIVTVPVKQGETVVGINRVLSKEQKQSAEEAGRERETWMYDI